MAKKTSVEEELNASQKELDFLKEEKEKLVTELALARKELAFQKEKKEKHEMVNKDVVDLRVLNHRTKSDPVLMIEMITLYLAQTPQLINTMKLSYQNKNWKSLHSSVHKMIPSFSIMGMSIDFENMAKKVQEFASSQKQTDDIADMVLKLEAVCKEACKELEEELTQLKANKNVS